MTLTDRLWTYQAERFPLARTVPLLAVFAAAGILVSAGLAGRAPPGPWAYIAGLILGLVVFFQLRVADEHKDFEDDLRYRPDRAVPRGLVSLKLLAGLAAGASLIAVAAALTRPAPTAITLLLVWGCMWLMRREFFVAGWLKAHPVLYLASHMAVMPLIDLMLTSLDWAGAGWPPPGIGVYLAMSFVNGCVLEIGRKTWAPASELDGVDSYSRLWGPRNAALIWLACVVVAAGLAALVGHRLGAGPVVGVAAVLGVLGAGWAALRFAVNPDVARQAWIDRAAGLWVFGAYAAVGFLPLITGAAP
ncbi:MAG: manganese transporter permease [Pseudomonadota bacterium]